MTYHGEKWDKRYLRLAREVAGWSKDPGTQVGAVMVEPRSGRVLSLGYNGFPRGIRDDLSLLSARSEKLKRVVHAEMNCIYNASHSGVSLDRATLYVYGLPLCSQCALGMIQVGVGRVVMTVRADRLTEEWARSWELTKKLLEETATSAVFYQDIDSLGEQKSSDLPCSSSASTPALER